MGLDSFRAGAILSVERIRITTAKDKPRTTRIFADSHRFGQCQLTRGSSVYIREIRRYFSRRARIDTRKDGEERDLKD